MFHLSLHHQLRTNVTEVTEILIKRNVSITSLCPCNILQILCRFYAGIPTQCINVSIGEHIHNYSMIYTSAHFNYVEMELMIETEKENTSLTSSPPSDLKCGIISHSLLFSSLLVHTATTKKSPTLR